jgi:methyl-accepting chemotaxis protein
MKRPWRRRNYFIKRDLQGRYVFNFFIFILFGTIIFTLIFSALTINTLTVVYEDYNLKIGKTPIVLLKEILKTHWFFLLTVGIAIVIASIFLTHRFAGPIYRFEKSVEEMIKGNFNFIIRLRKKDEGKELANLMNELISTISRIINEIKDISDKLGEETLLISEMLKKEEHSVEIKNSLEKIREAQKKLSNILSQFKTKNVE